MKRLSVLALLLTFALGAMAQQPNKIMQHKKQKAAGIIKADGQLKNFDMLGERDTQIDTFGNLLSCDSLFYVWWYGAEYGYVSGHNYAIDSMKAERYEGIPGDQINGLWIFFGQSTYTNSTAHKCVMKVWDNDGTDGLGNAGAPGTELGSVSLTHYQIEQDALAGNLSTVTFSTPITMPDGGNFYAGVKLEYAKKQGLYRYDSNRVVAFANPDFFDACADDSLENSAWECWTDGIFIVDGDTFDSDAAWYNYWDVYGLATRNPVFPIVETSSCEISVTPSAVAICKGKSTVLTASGDAGSYTWSPATGLNVTTGAVVTAKPSGTTTYTVSGDGGSCTATATVTVNSKPTVTVSQGACSGGAILLTRNGTPTTGVKFKWYRDNAAIAGATNSTYSATITGLYKCKVTIIATNCAKTSANQQVTITCKLGEEGAALDVSAFPNPFTKAVTINFANGSTEPADVILLDMSGRSVKEYNNVDVSSPLEINEDLNPGVYFVKVLQGQHEKMIKVVKND